MSGEIAYHRFCVRLSAKCCPPLRAPLKGLHSGRACRGQDAKEPQRGQNATCLSLCFERGGSDTNNFVNMWASGCAMSSGTVQRDFRKEQLQELQRIKDGKKTSLRKTDQSRRCSPSTRRRRLTLQSENLREIRERGVKRCSTRIGKWTKSAR